jgi:NAD(P)-dependent dehydrogenase (short-subunit alcohol dehydrogenase family)
VSPTVAWTELGQKAWGAEGVKEALFEKIPVGRAALPEEVADAVLFLCQVWLFSFLVRGEVVEAQRRGSSWRGYANEPV